MFPTWPVPRLYNQELVAVGVSQSSAAVICKVCKAARLLGLMYLRHGDSSGTQRKGNICHWNPLPRNGSDDVTLDGSVCVCVCVCNREFRRVSHALFE
jgi:hypothetical protein